MSNREILIPVHALVETLAKQSDENTPIKINNSDANGTTTTKTVTKYAAALVVGPSHVAGKKLTVIRTHGGVYRVPTEAVQNGTHGATVHSPAQFMQYYLLFNSPSSTETTVPTTKAAKALLTQCLDTVASRNDKGIELCVAGQNTIFLSSHLHQKLAIYRPNDCYVGKIFCNNSVKIVKYYTCTAL